MTLPTTILMRLASLLLDVGYLCCGLVLSPWVIYRLVRTGGWRRVPARLGLRLGAPLVRTIWLHGSSVGEISVLAPLVRLFEQEQPQLPLVISTCTRTGLVAAKRAYPRHRVVLFPVDWSFVAARFLHHFDPRLIVIVESEFWPNFLFAAARRHVPVALVNGKMSDKSRRAYARTGVVALALRGFETLAVQTRQHAARFRSLGVPAHKLSVTGNMKYDLVEDRGDQAASRAAMRKTLGFGDDDLVIIGGSLHPGENEALIDAFAALPEATGAALILVPRYPQHVSDVLSCLGVRGYAAVRKTDLDHGAALPQARNVVRVVDTIGELGSLYAAADIAFVGGSLFYRGSNKGGHNLMEPAILGLPIVFGPYNFSFRETVTALLEADAGVQVADRTQLAVALAALAGDPVRRRGLGERARDVILDGRGASTRNFRLLAPWWATPRAGTDHLQPLSLARTMPRASSDVDIQ